MKKVIFAALLAGSMLTACYNEGTLVVNPAPLAQYQFKPTEARLLEAAKAYAEAINQNLEQKAIHPGLFADYGVALARLGCLEQAYTMFNNEKTFFPNSTAYVDYLISTLTPRQTGDKHIDTSRIDLKSLDLTPEEVAFQQQLENDPEYQKMLKQQMKEEKEQKALETKKAKKELSKAKEAERRAKVKAKEKAQKEKEAAKKEAEKARKQEAKEAAKAKREAEKMKKKSPKE